MFKTFDNLTIYLTEKFGSKYYVLTNVPMFTIYLDIPKDINTLSDREKQFLNLCVQNKDKIEKAFALARTRITKDLQLRSMHSNVVLKMFTGDKEWAGKVDLSGLKTLTFSRGFINDIISSEEKLQQSSKMIVHEFLHAFHINLPKEDKANIEADFNKSEWNEETPILIFYKKFDRYFSYFWNEYFDKNITHFPTDKYSNDLLEDIDPNVNKLLKAKYFKQKQKRFFIYFWNVLCHIAKEMYNKPNSETKAKHNNIEEKRFQSFSGLMLIFSFCMKKLSDIYLNDKKKLKNVGLYPSSYLIKANKYLLNLFKDPVLENNLEIVLSGQVFGTGVGQKVADGTHQGRQGSRPYSAQNEYEYVATAGDTKENDSTHQKRISRILQTGSLPTRKEEKLYKV